MLANIGGMCCERKLAQDGKIASIKHKRFFAGPLIGGECGRVFLGPVSQCVCSGRGLAQRVWGESGGGVCGAHGLGLEIGGN